MATDRHQPDWDDNQLSLGKPDCMDTPTLIEWIERQLETPAETKYRHTVMQADHLKWHEHNPGIYACCIQTGALSLRVPYVKKNSEELYQQALEAFRSYSDVESQVVYLPEDVEVTYLYADNVKYAEVIDERPPPGIIREW